MPRTKIDIPNLPASITAERDGEVGFLRLSRPEKRNALNDTLVMGIETYFTGLPEDIRAVVLTGDGDHFSAGLDLSELTVRGIGRALHHSRNWHRVFDMFEFGKVPVIAVLHGAVVGGGLELASACHVRVAEKSAYYALPEGVRGIYVGGGGSVRIPRLIGVVAHDGHDADRPHLWRRRWADDGPVPLSGRDRHRPGKGHRTRQALRGQHRDDKLCRHACAATNCGHRPSGRLYDGSADLLDRAGRRRSEKPAERLSRRPRQQGDAAGVHTREPRRINRARCLRTPGSVADLLQVSNGLTRQLAARHFLVVVRICGPSCAPSAASNN